MKVTLYTIKVTLYNIKVTLYNIKVTLYNIKVTLRSIKVTLYTIKVTLYNIKVTLYNIKVTLCIIKSRSSRKWIPDYTNVAVVIKVGPFFLIHKQVHQQIHNVFLSNSNEVNFGFILYFFNIACISLLL